MSYLIVDKLTKAYTENPLLDDVSFIVNKGDKVALVAKNGAGKTTLMKIVMGLETPDFGNTKIQEGIRYGFLSQDDDFSGYDTVKDFLFNSDNELAMAVYDYEKSLKGAFDEDFMQKSYDNMVRLDAFDFEVKLNQILQHLKISDLMERKIENLSGGQKKRIALARVLIDRKDFLLLDEPTNHLDLDMIDWLEDYFAKEKITLFA